MANQSKRGGMKQGTGKQGESKKKQGVRPGSTAAAKERGNQGPRQKIVPDAKGGKSRKAAAKK